MEVKDVPLDLIDHPAVEMRDTVSQEYLESLANSIKEVGLLHPLRVRQLNGRYELVSGNCRFLALKLLGYALAPVIVTTTAEGNLAAMTLHENLIRQDVSPLETAKYLNHLRTASGKTVEELAKQFRYSTTWVYQHLKLLETNVEIQIAVDAEKISLQAGLELMRIPNESRRLSLLDSAVRTGATTLLIRSWVNQELADLGMRAPSPPVSPGAAMSDIPQITFVCALCLHTHHSDKQIIVRVDPDCYAVTQQAFRAMRSVEDGQQHSPAVAA